MVRELDHRECGYWANVVGRKPGELLLDPFRERVLGVGVGNQLGARNPHVSFGSLKLQDMQYLGFGRPKPIGGRRAASKLVVVQIPLRSSGGHC